MSDHETGVKPDDRFEPFYRPFRWSRSKQARYLSLWIAWLAGWGAYVVAARYFVSETWRAAIMTAVLLHVLCLAMDAVRFWRWKHNRAREDTLHGFE